MTQVRKRPATPRHAARCCGPIDDLLDPTLFKALCDPTRAKLLACLVKCGRGCSVGEVAEGSSVDLSVVSRHLRTLEAAGVLEAERIGRTVLYAVRFDDVVASLRSLADAIEALAPSACSSSSCCAPSRSSTGGRRVR